MNNTMSKFATQALRQIGRAALGALLVSSAVQATAQTWPTKPVHVIVGFAPGGGTDIVARALSVTMTAALGQ